MGENATVSTADRLLGALDSALAEQRVVSARPADTAPGD